MNKSIPKHYWFKRRRYGYGWTPTTWQGWTVLLAFLVVLVAAAFFANYLAWWVYLIIVGVSVVVLVIIAAIKGPSPKWRWGSKDSDNEETDF